jgi:hypothetical protein
MFDRVFGRLGLPALLLALVIAGCQTVPPSERFPEIRFTDRPPLILNVDRVEVVEEFVPARRMPYIGDRFPNPLLPALRQWSVDRLRANGGTRQARFFIKEASAKEEDLPRTKGVRGVFTVDQAKRYTVVIDSKLEIRSDRGLLDGFAAVRISRTATAPENITEADLQRLWHDLAKQTLESHDAEMERQIEMNLREFLERGN